MIQLIGPGGAGKTTAGAALAARLRVRFVDQDAEFMAANGDISTYLDTHGYDAYAARNVRLYPTLIREHTWNAVVALSSGFMTYRDDVHPDYVQWRERIVSNRSTFVLRPSLDLETCVVEVVRRQLLRPFSRGSEREDQVIRTRFHLYVSLPARKVETMRPCDAVVPDLLDLLAGAPVGA